MFRQIMGKPVCNAYVFAVQYAYMRLSVLCVTVA